MATPSPDFKFDPADLHRFMEKIGVKQPARDPYAPYQVGQREHRKSPGHRSWSEVWVCPRRPKPGEDHFKHSFHEYYEIHQGADFIHSPEFWEEVEMLSGEDDTVEDLRGKMGSLDAEAVEAGYAHYYDKYIWEDDSPRVRRLMEAFEAEHKAPAGTRLFDKVSKSLLNDVMYTKFSDKIHNIILDDSKMNIIAA